MKKLFITTSLCTSIAISFFAYSNCSQSNNAIDNLPDLGSSAENVLPPHLASQVGNAFVRQARAQMEFIDDPLLLDYINSLGNKLSSVASQGTLFENQTFTFHLIKDDSINAFAVPGGHIFIHSGLINSSKNEGQLAATLAHEIAHITENHSARGIENSQYDGVIAMAAVLLAIASGDAETAQVAITASQGGIIQKRLNFSRAFEREADDKAISTLHRAGFDPKALPQFLTILDQKQKLSSSNPPAFLLTHPLTAERISMTELRANAIDSSRQANQYSTSFNDFKAKISVDSVQNAKLIAQSLRLDKNSLIEPSDYYKYGLALTKLNQFSQAENQLEIALSKDALNLNYLMALNDLDLAKQDFQSAINRFEDVKVNRFKDYKKIALYHAYTLIMAKQNKKAIAVLKQVITDKPKNPDARILLARAYGEQNLLFESFSQRAEYHYLRGNLDFAIQQINTAMSYAPDIDEKKRLRSTLRDYQEELRNTKEALKKL